MSYINRGGPVFPQPQTYGEWADGSPWFEGMTLRDYFAIHGPEPSEQQVLDYFLNKQTLDIRLARAELRYLEADAMLKAREA